MRPKKRFRSNADRRDLPREGQRVPLEKVDRVAKLEDFVRCPHCYYEVCKCEGEPQRYPRYSPADYMPYQLTEDDLIACIDLLNSLEEFE